MFELYNPKPKGQAKFTNKGEDEPRTKIAAVSYYEPWDWVIGAGAYEDDFYEVSKNIKGVSTVSKDSATSAQSMASAAEMLTGATKEIKQLIDQFKV